MSGFLLHLLRHGAPATPGLLMGRTDGDPTPEGIAACVAQVSEVPFTRVIGSDLKRALQAAETIGGQRYVSVHTDPRWRELDFGDWDGLAASAIDGAAIGRFWDDPDGSPPPNGERWSGLVGRVSSAIEGLVQEDTLVVTHAGAMRAALACLLGFDQRQIWAFDLPYGALLTLRIWSGPTRSAQIVGLWP